MRDIENHEGGAPLIEAKHLRKYAEAGADKAVRIDAFATAAQELLSDDDGKVGPDERETIRNLIMFIQRAANGIVQLAWDAEELGKAATSSEPSISDDAKEARQ